MLFRPCLILLCAAVASLALECTKPVGLEDRTIPDSSMTANSEINRFHRASEGRLNNYRRQGVGVGSWCADKNDAVVNRYIEIDLGSVRKIGKIATQGRNTTHPQYVKEYRITHSQGGSNFEGIFDIFLEERITDEVRNGLKPGIAISA